MFIHTLIKLEYNQCGTQAYSLIGTYKYLQDAQDIAGIHALSEDLEIGDWEEVIIKDDKTEYVAFCRGKYYSCIYKIHMSYLIG